MRGREGEAVPSLRSGDPTSRARQGRAFSASPEPGDPLLRGRRGGVSLTLPGPCTQALTPCARHRGWGWGEGWLLQTLHGFPQSGTQWVL